MNDDQTAAVVRLQQRISSRLAELGYADPAGAQRISRHLAEISVGAREFADTTLPLLLSMNPENESAIGQLIVSLKCDLDDIGDAIQDVKRDIEDLVELLNRDLPGR